MTDGLPILLYEESSAAEDYSAALSWLGASLPSSWTTKDWVDGPMHWRFLSAVETPTQGWKIHVSASAYECPKMLRAVVPTLLAMGAAFKVPQRIDDVVYLNSGDAGLEQIGKILTIYPCDDDAARNLIIALDTIWPCSNGPEVCTDLHIRPYSAVSFRFGVFRPGPIVVDSTGRYSHAITHPTGNLSTDQRQRDGTQPRGFALPIKGYLPSPCPFRVKDDVTVGRANYILLSVISETPQSVVYLAADTTNFETAVVKVVRPGVGGDAFGRDCGDLLNAEFQILSVLAPHGIAPWPLGWSDVPWPSLVVQDLRGSRLSELPQAERIAALPHLVYAIARMHEVGFVHGDIKLENALRLEERVVLIDFELAAPVGGSGRRGGTRGHLAPEVGNGYRSMPARDVYALGGCLFQAVMGIPPGLVASDSMCLANLLRNENAYAAADLFEYLTASDPEARPTADAAVKAFERLAEGPDIDGGKLSQSFADLRWCRSASIDAARAVSLFAQHGEEGIHWRNMHFQRGFDCEALNIGAAGVLIGLMSIDAAAGTREFDNEISGGAHWLASAGPAGKAAGLFTGNAGVALALTLAARRLDNSRYANAARDRLLAAAADRREIDFFSGSTGVLFACCLISEITKTTWAIELAAGLAHDLLNTVGRQGGVPIWGTEGEAKADYLGCAHGSAGFALALAAYGRAASDPDAIALARETFVALHHAGRTDSGALRMTLQSERHHAVGNWCHGVAGYLWAILQGLGDDPALREEIDWGVECLSNAPAVGTPTYCHGLAGQLELWRMLGEIPRFEALASMQARKVASALRILSQDMDGHCVWVSDNPDIVTPDLWVGFLGPATDLALYAAQIQSSLLSPKWLTACAQ